MGAHYDTVAGTVGANDNATGVAATLARTRTANEGKSSAEDNAISALRQ